MVLLKNVNSKKDKHFHAKTISDEDSWKRAFKGTNGSGIKVSKKFGKYRSDNVTLSEVALNKKVLRVPLVQYDLKGLKSKLASRRRILYFERNLKAKRKTERKTESSLVIRRSTINLNGIANRGKIVLSKTTKLANEIGKTSSNKITEVSSKKRRGIQQSYRTPERTIEKSEKNKFKIRLFPPKKTIQNKKNTTQNKSMEKSTLPNLTYCLKFNNESNVFADGKLNYTFQKLITDVKDMKLPSPTWKIKVIIRQNKIHAVTFTNKLDPERSVSFTSENENYKIVIDNEQACLLGSPGAVNNARDIEILLDIVQNIKQQDPMLLYK